jgi:protease-4
LQRAGFQREMDKIYEDFVGIVAEGRDMSREAVIAVAEGRVWTGEQALERGLVDELGGFETALAATKRLAEMDADAEVSLQRFPRPKSREELFNELLSGGAQAGSDLESLSLLLSQPEVKAMLRARDAMVSDADRTMKANLPVVR